MVMVAKSKVQTMLVFEVHAGTIAELGWCEMRALYFRFVVACDGDIMTDDSLFVRSRSGFIRVTAIQSQ